MPPRRRKRVDPALFELPVARIRAGEFSDVYFTRAQAALRAEPRVARVTWQVSAKRGGWLGGIDEAVALLRLCSEDFAALEVNALFEGDRVEPWDTVLLVEGDYAGFAHLETLIVGTLARRTRVCTNVRQLVDAARPKPVYYFGARSDHALLQPGDGLAAHVGGAASVSTDAQGAMTGKKGVGTIPHALIAAFGGDTVAAAMAMVRVLPPEVPLVALVDYANDSVATALEVARALEGRLWGVRLDTAEFMVDRSVVPAMGAFRPTGVNPVLVWNVRNALDAEGFGEVRIVASGGFDVERIRAFEDEGIPVDAYGVGASVHGGRWDFTADVVQLGGAPQAKAGRELRPNARMERVK
ncbi:MAG: Quinolinate phosphoribosyl transferase [Gemmatimonadetes bacterium]|jgi:nicotinate phosphoribosyltransferase|nr:Quinolinate phosphoribosyl transferase [Gemmatimonadota bacterium]